MSNHSQNQVRIAAANEYRNSPALQAEHTSEASYIAYRCAMARGAARIHAPAALTIHVKNQAAPAAHASHRALAGDFLSAEAEAAFNAAEARGAVRILGKPAAPATRAAGAMPSPAVTKDSVSAEALKVARALIASPEYRTMGRNQADAVIAARAGVSHDAAGAARSRAVWEKGSGRSAAI